MNVQNLHVLTEHAFPALVDKLSNVSGVVVEDADPGSGRLTLQLTTSGIAPLSKAFSKFLFHDWLFEMLQGTLHQKYSNLTDDELEYLTLVFVHELRTEELRIGTHTLETWERRARNSLCSLLAYADNFTFLGFAQFRLRNFLTDVTSVLDERVRQFLLDREYEESVAMLRYMLEAQPPGEQELHVFCTVDRVWITDESGNLVRDAEVTEAVLEESAGDLDSEDLAISILITRAPCRIILHDMHPDAVWPSFPDTLKRVFVERVESCNHCSTCKQLEQAHHHLPLDASNDHRFRRNH